MNSDNYKRFSNLGFDDFRQLAQDDSLSCYERIGFPDSYRKGKERAIFDDILGKLPVLESNNKVVLDIGPGCSELPTMLIEHCHSKGHQLILIDSAEMLARLPDRAFIEKVAAYYPECKDVFAKYTGKVDVILSYSVLHYVFAESNIWAFLDGSLMLLSHGGEMLIGDIPNISKRKRFFSSPTGIEFHQQFMATEEHPEVTFNQVEPGQIDDAVILSLLMRARSQGCDAYVMPQPADLPMANRREDILIRKP